MQSTKSDTQMLAAKVTYLTGALFGSLVFMSGGIL